MPHRMRRRLFAILHEASVADPVARAVNIAIMALILLSVVSVVLETVRSISERHYALFRTVETVTVIVFSVEYALRLWVCTLDPRYAGAVRGRVRFALSGMALVDLAAILPFYLPFAVGVMKLDFRFLRAVRLLRIFRLLKLGRYSRSLQTLGDVLNRKKDELLIALFVVSILLVISSSLMYYIENEVQPKAFSSIPAAMWWAVVTLATVGYGDVYPVTALGRLLGAVVSLLGIGLFALPAGLLGSAFVEELQRKSGKPAVCPHCGKPVE